MRGGGGCIPQPLPLGRPLATDTKRCSSAESKLFKSVTKICLVSTRGFIDIFCSRAAVFFTGGQNYYQMVKPGGPSHSHSVGQFAQRLALLSACRTLFLCCYYK